MGRNYRYRHTEFVQERKRQNLDAAIERGLELARQSEERIEALLAKTREIFECRDRGEVPPVDAPATLVESAATESFRRAYAAPVRRDMPGMNLSKPQPSATPPPPRRRT